MDDSQKTFLKRSGLLDDAGRPASPPKPKPPAPERHDFLKREMGGEFRGEETGRAWTAKPKPGESKTDLIARREKAAKESRTRYFDADEKAAHSANVKDGRLTYDQDGSKVTGTSEFAIDPETGATILKQGPGGSQDTGAATSTQGGQQEVLHHSSMNAGEAVALAGEIQASWGKIALISNDSGHYKPKFEHLLQGVEHFVRQGAMLDDTLVDMDTKQPLNSRMSSVYEQAGKVSGHVATKLAEIDAWVKANQDSLGESDAPDPELQSMIEEFEARKWLHDEALALLREIGAGPSNKMVGTVDYVDGSDDQTGAEFRTEAKHTRMEPEEFLSGTPAGGQAAPRGPRDARPKQAFHERLRTDPKAQDLIRKNMQGAEVSENEPQALPASDLDDRAGALIKEFMKFNMAMANNERYPAEAATESGQNIDEALFAAAGTLDGQMTIEEFARHLSEPSLKQRLKELCSQQFLQPTDPLYLLNGDDMSGAFDEDDDATEDGGMSNEELDAQLRQRKNALGRSTTVGDLEDAIDEPDLKARLKELVDEHGVNRDDVLGYFHI